VSQLPALTPPHGKMALAADPAGAIIQANMEPTGLQLRGTAQNCPAIAVGFQFWPQEEPNVRSLT